MEVTSEWETGSDFDEQDAKLWWAVNLSLIGNIALLLVKAYAFAVSGSFAVLAALADSGVDLASQIVLYFCNRCAPAQFWGQYQVQSLGPTLDEGLLMQGL